MKTTTFLLALGFSLLIATTSKAQSSFEILSKGASDAKYVAIKGEEIKSKERYVYTFSNLSRYRILVKHENASSKMLVKILDKDEKEIASNFHKKKYHKEINFKCGKTGMYYVVFQEVKN